MERTSSSVGSTPCFSSYSSTLVLQNSFGIVMAAVARALVIDADHQDLETMKSILTACKYEVLGVDGPSDALKMLQERKIKIKLVVADVHMPTMCGFKFVDIITNQFKIPVVAVSNDNRSDVMAKAISSGAFYYMTKKAVNISFFQGLWRATCEWEENRQILGIRGSQRRNNGTDGDKNEIRKKRTVWTPELHGNFVAAIESLGTEKIIPTNILRIMNIEGLTRKSVGSHLQKYREYLKRRELQKQNTSQLEYQSLPSGEGHSAPSFSENNIHQQLNKLSNPNEPGQENNAGLQLYNMAEMVGVEPANCNSSKVSENLRFSNFVEARTQVGESSGGFANPKLFQPTPQKPEKRAR